MKLVDKAFTARMGGLRLGTSKYRTKPLESALKSYFKDEQIFGGQHENSASYARKVAVTAACETGEQAVIFTNYNRAEDVQGKTCSSIISICELMPIQLAIDLNDRMSLGMNSSSGKREYMQ
jgi:hypothetical protein